MKSLITIDVEGAISSAQQSEDLYNSVGVLEGFLAELDNPVTLFVTPGVVEECSGVVQNLLNSSATVGLHIHPARLDGGTSDRLSEYDREAIEGFLAEGCETFEEKLGTTPTCFRAGRWEYSEQLLEALHAQGFEQDASLKPVSGTEPYSKAGIREYPLTVYSNPAIRFLTSLWEFEGVPMHADAFLTNRVLTRGFFGVTRRLIKSELPYIMVSYHDYDVLEKSLRDQLKCYHEWLSERTRCTTLDAV